jgi:rare lipoprotein A
MRYSWLMRYRPLVLLLIAGLAGCATQAPPPASRPSLPPQPPVVAAPAPRQPEAPQPPALPPQTLAAGPFFTETGLASFYGLAHAGLRTASGEKFDHRAFTAAHRTLPFGTLVRVTNLGNGRTVTVEITDRGPRIKSRVIDVSLAAAQEIDMQRNGVVRVRVEAFQADQPERR